MKLRKSTDKWANASALGVAAKRTVETMNSIEGLDALPASK